MTEHRRSISAPLKVLIVEDNSIWAAGMQQALVGAQGIADVYVAYTVEQAVHMAGEHLPDVLLLDLKIGSDWGLRVARVLNFRGHPARIAIVTSESTPFARAEASELGVVGFIDKSAIDLSTLASLVRSIAKRTTPINVDGEGLESPLTSREIEYLVCFREGLGTPAIMERLGVGKSTVRNVTSAIGVKLCVIDRVPGSDKSSLRLALVREAIRLGIIAPARRE